MQFGIYVPTFRASVVSIFRTDVSRFSALPVPGTMSYGVTSRTVIVILAIWKCQISQSNCCIYHIRTRKRKINAGSYTSEKVGLRLNSRLVSEIWWVRAGMGSGSGETSSLTSYLLFGKYQEVDLLSKSDCGLENFCTVCSLTAARLTLTEVIK